LLFLLAAAEMWRPLHVGGGEPGGRIAGNVGLGLINAGLGAVLPLSTVLPAEWAARHGVGLMNAVALPPLAAVAATVLVRNLATYWIHRLSHAVPLLWRVHRVHHADVRLDLSTGFRNHPLELAFVAPWLAAVTVAGGLDPATLAIYEAAAIGFSLWSHANLGLPERLDRWLRLALVTPAMHHVHHSALRDETDSNYGDVLSLWDRLFGTYRDLPADRLTTTRFGLGDAFDPAAPHLLSQLASPFARGGRRSEA
jgi:sterol desaturase/sphingolipid hydroxylase (fatty acid hydroxylase superfamily)